MFLSRKSGQLAGKASAKIQAWVMKLKLKSGGYGNRERKRRETFQRKDEKGVSKAQSRGLGNYLTQISGEAAPDCLPPGVS